MAQDRTCTDVIAQITIDNFLFRNIVRFVNAQVQVAILYQ